MCAKGTESPEAEVEGGGEMGVADKSLANGFWSCEILFYKFYACWC